eukprot:14191034-Ditylum_brightwellii.AAC.1
MSTAMKKKLESQDKSYNNNKIYKNKPSTKLKRNKKNIGKMKEECAKMKKDLDDGKGYGDGTKTNIDGDMISLCKCPGCPGKKNHKTTTSKECIWHQQFIGVTAGKTKQSFVKMTEQYSPVGDIDVADVLAKIISNCIMDVADTEAELVGEYKVLQNDSNGVATNLTGLLSTSSNSVGSPLDEILGKDLLVPMP